MGLKIFTPLLTGCCSAFPQWKPLTVSKKIFSPFFPSCYLSFISYFIGQSFPISFMVSSSSTITRRKVSSEALLIYTLSPPSLSASYTQPWPLSCCSSWSSPDHSPKLLSLQIVPVHISVLGHSTEASKFNMSRANLPETHFPLVFYISFHSTTYPSYWARVRESCLKLTDTHFIIFMS